MNCLTGKSERLEHAGDARAGGGRKENDHRMGSEFEIQLDSKKSKETETEIEIENEENDAMHWEDWEDTTNENSPAIPCVFCAELAPDLTALEAHLQHAHQGFSLRWYQREWHLDFYGMIRFVNYLRKFVQTNQSQEEEKETERSANVVAQVVHELNVHGMTAFAEETFFTPVIANDPLMFVNWESDDDIVDDATDEESESFSDAEKETFAKGNQHMTNKNSVPTESILKRWPTNEHLQDLVQALSVEEDKASIQSQGKHRNINDDDNDEDDDDDEKNIKVDNDSYYFDSYSQVGIHREMILDKVRTDAYMHAMLQNRSMFEGKIVLDVGCGTGILSMFAAQAGAALVIGVDCSTLLSTTQRVIQENGFADRIHLIQSKIEDIVELPTQGRKVDIIISEWMGYGLLYESMLDSVLYARDEWLSKQGFVFPDQAVLYLQGISDSSKRFAFWENAYGFNFRAIQERISHQEAFVEVVPPEDVVTNRFELKHLDIEHVSYEELNFTSAFELNVVRSGMFHGFVASFDIHFVRGLTSPISFSTGCESAPTHWKQTFFHVNVPFKVKCKDVIRGQWSMKRNTNNPRCIDVNISWACNQDNGGRLSTTQAYIIQ